MKKLSWIAGINWLAMMMIIISTILVVFNAVANGVNWAFWFSSVLLVISAILVGYSLRINYNLDARGSSKKEDPYDEEVSQKIKILSQLIKDNAENEANNNNDKTDETENTNEITEIIETENINDADATDDSKETDDSNSSDEIDETEINAEITENDKKDENIDKTLVTISDDGKDLTVFAPVLDKTTEVTDDDTEVTDETTEVTDENTENSNENNDEILELDENKEPENDTVHRIFTMPEFKKEPEQPFIEEIVETTDNVNNSLQITIETTDEEPIEEIIVEKADKENKETSETPSEK